MPYPQRAHLVQHLFPTTSVNLFAGPSGAGKTRLLFQLVMDLLAGNSIFGFPCLAQIRPIYFCYDRLMPSVYETLNELKLDFGESLPLSSFAGYDNPRVPALAKVKDYNFIILDGIDALVGEGKIIDFGAVTRIIRGCQTLVSQTQGCVVGVLGTTKLKMDGSGYAHSREKLIGSTSWARMSDNLVLVMPDIKDPSKNNRSIDICLRNGGADRSLPYKFNSEGWLMPIEDVEDEDTKLSIPADSLLKLWPDTAVFSTEQLEILGEQQLTPPISRATLFRLLTELMSHQLIVKSKHGIYCRNVPKTQ